jgi:hypothetical protein
LALEVVEVDRAVKEKEAGAVEVAAVEMLQVCITRGGSDDLAI